MATQAARKLPARSIAWTNALPAWIQEDPAFASLKPGLRHTLQTVANACDPPTADGSLLVCFGGQQLYRRIGIQPSTWWEHLKRLELLGYLVTLRRGGVYGSTNYGNQYGIPGTRGALDHRRCRRETRRMIRGSDGVLRPQILHPGDQTTLWPTSESTGGVSENRTGGCPKIGRGSSEVRTQPSPLPSPSTGRNHGVSRQRGGRKRPGLRCVTQEDLQDLNRLARLFRSAADQGLIDRSEDSFLRLVAMAQHCLRVGHNPPALFAANVAKGRWLMITQEDDERARRRLAAFRHGVSHRRRNDTWADQEEILDPRS